jgi:CheY-like chemotaxis protein
MARLDRVHVLLVDDDADSIEIVRVMLESEGARVTSAANADDALAKARTAPPDVVLCDISMPTHDGFWFLGELRKTTMGRDVPAGALTAHASAATRDEVLAAGFLVHVTKPADPQTLAAAVRELAARLKRG